MTDLNNIIDLNNVTPKNQRFEMWSGIYEGYSIEVYQNHAPFDFVPKWFYRIKKENFVFDSLSENKYGYQSKVSASGAAYQHILELKRTKAVESEWKGDRYYEDT